MKKLANTLIVICTINTQAQEKSDSKRQSRGNKQKYFIQNLTPQEAATLKTKKMTLQLDLTESQQLQIQHINLEQAKERIAKKKERMKNMGKKKVKLSKDNRLNKIHSRLDKQIELKKQFKNILTDEQFEKWERSKKQKDRKIKKRVKQKSKKSKSKRN